MKPQIALHFPSASYPFWCKVGRYDSLAAELADGHYSRQSPGDDQYMPPGRCVAFVHHGQPTRRKGSRGLATWGVVYNVFRDVWRWRNSIFHNDSTTLTSELVEAGTLATYIEWRAQYGELPPQPLITEIDIEATKARRSKHKEPGACYRAAGWREVARRTREHGRPALVILEAPR